MRQLPVLALLALIVTPCAVAQDVEVEVSESALNRLVARLGSPSDGGLYTPTTAVFLPGLFEDCQYVGRLGCPNLGGPGGGKGGRTKGFEGLPIASCRTKGGGVVMVPAGEPVSWQWWVTDVRYRVDPGALSLCATIRSRVGQRWEKLTRTVPATVGLDAANAALRVSISSFKVPLSHDFEGTTKVIAEVDAARLLAISIPLEPQTLQISLLDGGSKVLTGRAVSATPTYEDRRIRVGLGLGFN